MRKHDLLVLEDALGALVVVHSQDGHRLAPLQLLLPQRLSRRLLQLLARLELLAELLRTVLGQSELLLLLRLADLRLVKLLPHLRPPEPRLSELLSLAELRLAELLSLTEPAPIKLLLSEHSCSQADEHLKVGRQWFSLFLHQ